MKNATPRYVSETVPSASSTNRRRPEDVPAVSDKQRRRGRPRGPFTQARRLEMLRGLLQRHPKGLTIYDLALELNVTTRSMRRYLAEVKRELDLETDTPKPGGAALWRLAPGETARKVEVRRTQAYALLAARRLFEPMKGSALYDEILMASDKLLGVARRPGRGPNAGVADARLEERFLYLPFAPKDYAKKTEELDDLFQAVADLRPLSCKYRRPDGKEEKITVHPYAMVLYKDAIYCVGLHVAKDDVRTFLLDRMRDTECSARERFTLPETFRIDDYMQGQFGIFKGSGDSFRVVIDFDLRVREYVETRRIHPSQRLEQVDGRLRLTMTLSDLTEVSTWVLSFGETATVIEPPALRDRVVSELRNALARYEEPKKAVGRQPSAVNKNEKVASRARGR